MIANAIGMEKLMAAAPARTRMSSTSSVAYATDDIASEEKTASATVLRSRSCRACASGMGRPTRTRLRSATLIGAPPVLQAARLPLYDARTAPQREGPNLYGIFTPLP